MGNTFQIALYILIDAVVPAYQNQLLSVQG